jgi:anhydro-N-acetylmuramic acid kinase
LETFTAIGLNSGTSRDGIDLALLETDGHSIVRPLARAEQAYSADQRELLAEACAVAITRKMPDDDEVTQAAGRMVNALHVDFVKAFLRDQGLEAEAIDVIGFHGHTIAHRPEFGWTWQIGSGRIIADNLHITVVDDFRSADVKAGGQGAPLTPVYHRALAARLPKPVAILNLGGVANISWIGRDNSLIAFDCGMANALIDDWMLKHYGVPYDANGEKAREGRVIKLIFEDMTSNLWFKLPPPKSLEREHFASARVDWMDPLDGVATLTAFSAAGVALAMQHLPEMPREILVAGGGRHNATLLAMIEAGTGLPVRNVDDLGWNGDALEAEAFAYMAVRAMKYDPISFPGTTGAPRDMAGGVINRV